MKAALESEHNSHQWRAEGGGANGAPAPGIQNRGESKEQNYKNLNAVTR